MHPIFSSLVEGLNAKFEQLVGMTPISAGRFPTNMPSRGVYLFSEGANYLYVGRSNNIRGRYGRHCNAGATHRMAAFAFRLAREQTGRIQPTYKSGEGSRKHLAADKVFAPAFGDAKRRIREMDFRCVEESDPKRQCLLEIYCAVVLNTAYNDFDNH
jgi:hypothetical protein